MSTPTITISIPAFNDSHAIQELIAAYHQAGIHGENISYLLIDDGSSDDTASTIQQLASTYPRIQTILHDKNYGFGYTIKEAITTPKTDFILFISGDHQFHANAAQKLLDEISPQVDYVLGKRNKRSDNLYRRAVSKTYNLLISTLTCKKVYDINSIFMLRSSVLKGIQLNSQSAFIHAEIYLKLKENGAVCKEISIPHYARKFGVGSGGRIKVIIPTLIDLIKYISHALTTSNKSVQSH